MEYSLQHQLPNFAEVFFSSLLYGMLYSPKSSTQCWWDHVRLVYLCSSHVLKEDYSLFRIVDSRCYGLQLARHILGCVYFDGLGIECFVTGLYSLLRNENLSIL